MLDRPDRKISGGLTNPMSPVSHELVDDDHFDIGTDETNDLHRSTIALNLRFNDKTAA